MTEKLISINSLSKEFLVNKNKTCILKNINFSIVKGDIISIAGPSGSGKSTFLNILGLLDSVFSGTYDFLDFNVNLLKNNEKNIIRNKSIGFVHQFFYLIPELTVLENVSLPNLILNNQMRKSNDLAKEIIVNCGLENRMYSKPTYLSGGEQQRVAIARALINNPELIIADEMTGNLDEKTADTVFEFFLDKISSNNQTLIYVTHNEKYAKKANTAFEISNNQIHKI